MGSAPANVLAPNAVTVRRARANLASSLARELRPAEAIEELRSALDEDGDDPADALLHAAIARLCEETGDSASALEAYLRSVVSDPRAEVAAEAAARLLPHYAPAPRWQDLVGRLGSVARQDPDASAAACLLAAQLLRRDDDLPGAAELYERALATGPVDRHSVLRRLVDACLEQGDIGAAGRALDRFSDVSEELGLKAWVQLESGAVAKALRTAETAHGQTAAATAAFAHIALGAPSAALALLDGHAERDLSVARVIAHLAARQYGDARTVLAGIGPTPETAALLQVLRVQTLLEGAGDDAADTKLERPFDDVDEARNALDRVARAEGAVTARTARLLRHRWLRIQHACRGEDDRWRYAYAEMSVALGEPQRHCREAVAACAKLTTTYLQNAALVELGVTLAPADDPAVLADALDAAREAVAGQDDPIRALVHAHQAALTIPTVERACALADLAWRISYTELSTAEADQLAGLLGTSPGGGAEDPAAVKRTWLEYALDRLDDVRGELAGRTDQVPAYRYGLCLARSGELDETPGLPLQWDAAPYLLAAALGDVDGFKYANAARVLHDAGAYASAYACAVRAREFEPDDPWIREVEIYTNANYRGVFEELAVQLEEYQRTPGADEGWSAETRYLCALMSGGDPAADEPSEPAAWLRPIIVLAHIAHRGLPACRGEVEAFMTATDFAAADPDQAADLYRCLGRLDDADKTIIEAEREGRCAPDSAERARAMTALARGDAASEQWLADLLAREVRPTALRSAMELDLLALRECFPATSEPVARLIDVCRRRLDELLDSARALTDDLDHAPDDTQRPVLRLLLAQLDAERGEDWPGASCVLADLATVHTGEILGAAIRVSSASLAAQAASGLVGRVLDDASADGSQWSAALERLSTVAGAAVAIAWGAAAGRQAEATNATSAAIAAARGLAAPEHVDLMADALAGEVRTVTGYRVAADAVAATGAAGSRLRDRLVHRLGELLDPVRRSAYEVATPVTPIAVEVGAQLVRHVDPKLDGGDFYDTLIPQLKSRVHATTGVRLPGIRFRPSSDTGAAGFVVRIDEVPCTRGSVPLDSPIAVVEGRGRAPTPDEDVVRFHPLTGEPGVWIITPDDSARGEPLTVQTYLLAALESTLRRHLARVVGVDEVSAMMTEWREKEVEAAAVAAAPDDMVALTWIVQAALDDHVSLADWPAMLSAVAAAGGVAAPLADVRDAVQHTLRVSVKDGPIIEVPADHQDRVASEGDQIARHDFLVWLRAQVGEHGPALVLTTRDRQVRRAVDRLARAQHDLVITVTPDQVVT